MRWGISVLIVAAFACLVVPAAVAAEGPEWVIMSTEENEGFDPGGFASRHALQLYTPFVWKGLKDNIFFDPGPGVTGFETGLDAFHLMGDLCYFSTEVDFVYNGVNYRDQDLLVWDGLTLTTEPVFDAINAMLGDDYGLDAVCFVDDVWAFSTEVDGVVDRVGAFTDGDVLVWNGENLEVFPLFQYFGRNVGLDALHAYHEQGPNEETVQIIMSTEVDGEIYDPHTGTTLSFRDEDVVTLSLRRGLLAWYLDRAEVPWKGIEGFGRDVGLDALYIGPEIPEPATVLLVGAGLGALVLRLRRKR